MISIVVPTLNERARITGLLESLSALPGEKEIEEIGRASCRERV